MWFCLLSFYIFFALFSSSSHDRNFNQLCSIGDACCDWMMTGGSGYISGGSVEERCEIQGNETADKEEKAAVKNNDINVIVNLRWFYIIQRKVGEMRSAGKNRRDEIVISRMRFGHTRLNSTLYKMGKHDTGRCEFCGQEE